ncbi:MAG: GAF domain-containing protein [Leptolyngbyaceae cyanobacterium SM1_3_5]|nr:GAF domain-containing protein [Leptolyngbyaceae cyanobacterium SM1_3_5]
MPLLFGNTFLGNITLRSTHYRQYQPEELELAQALAYQATLALQLIRLAEEARQTAVAKLNEVSAREQEQAAQERATELEKANETLRQRDRLLSVVAEVTKDLLHNSQVEQAIVQAFQQISEAASISRMTLMREKLEVSSGRLQHHVIQEWVASGIPRQMDDPATKVMYSDEYGALCDELRAGRSIWYVIEDLPEPVQTQQKDIAVKSTGAVPIFIEGQYFGCVAFDDCSDYRQWTPHEVDVLTSSAGAIGAALHRKQLVDRLVAERIQAEQERAAELAKTNQALKNSIDRLAADPDLNGFLGQVILEIIEQLSLYTAWVERYDPAAQTLQIHLLANQGTLQLKPELPGRSDLSQGYSVQDSAAWNLLLQTKQPLVITLETLPQFFAGDDLERQRQWTEQFGIQCGINLLLIMGDEPLGILVLFSTDRARFTREELELAQALAQQATLAIQLMRLAEEAKQAAILEERNRMARDIHDTLAQSLTGVVMQLNAATEFLISQPAQTQTCITRAQNLAKQGLAEARRSVWLLYDSNLNPLGLPDSLTRLVEQMTTRTVHISLTIVGTPCCLDAAINMALLRIAQESLTNALRHAQPQTIHLQLTYTPQQIQLQVRDDGCGFDLQQPTERGLGIVGMGDRAKAISAQLQIESKLGIGTQTIVTVAIAPP